MKLTQSVRFLVIKKILDMNLLKVDSNPETQYIETTDYKIKSKYEINNMRRVNVEIKSISSSFWFNIDTRQQGFWSSYPKCKRKRMNEYYVWID